MGKPMRPDVAQAFDRMAAAARRDRIYLIVVSGYRSDAEQARLFAAQASPRLFPSSGSPHREADLPWTRVSGGVISTGPALAANGRLCCAPTALVQEQFLADFGGECLTRGRRWP